MSDLVGESLAGLQLLMVLALAPVAWLSVDLALLEILGFGMLDSKFDKVLREICKHKLVVYEQKKTRYRDDLVSRGEEH